MAGGYCGAGYNYYIQKLMDKPDTELVDISKKENTESILYKLFARMDLYGRLDSLVASHILDARTNPEGKIAKKINWKIDSYRKERGGEVYNQYLVKLSEFSKEKLSYIVNKWNKKLLIEKIVSSLLHPTVDLKIEYKVAKEFITAREYPNGEIAKKINSQLKLYKKDK